jgi:uncharacterized protein (DUF1697 family)
MKFIALLKGINVSGKKMIKMSDLKLAFESLGFRNVKTYVQSGNVIFDYEPTEETNLSVQIEKKISQTFGFFVTTIIRTSNALENIINSNPFIKDPTTELDKLHITFLSDMPESNIESSLDIKKEENEQFIIIAREVYLYCPNGYGNTKLNNAVFEKKLHTTATTRNWRTVNHLLEISKQV